MKKLIPVILTLAFIVHSCVNTEDRQKPNFSVSNNENWHFELGDGEGKEAVTYNDNDWRVLDLPHDWSIEGEYDEANPMGDRCGYLPAGIAWYRKTIDVPQNWKNKYVEIEFDGVFMNSTVYANGVALGNHPYGWTSFAYDISHIVATSDKITFAVRVDNDLQPSARWYTGSGIYAPSRFNVKEKINIPRNGIFVSTKGNKVMVECELKNETAQEKEVDVTFEIINSTGQVLAKKTTSSLVEKFVKLSEELELENPKLWDIDSPNLYMLQTTLKSKGKCVHQERTRFGFRDIKWETETGFWLNGRNIKLQGVCNHQDAGALGAAVPEKINRYRILQLKAMGVNAIRTAHNPQTPDFYRTCDEVGMLVMDEIFDGWKQKAYHDYGANFFDTHWRSDLTEWIRRDRNHPSVVIYSVGNETRGPVAPEIVALCHSLDSTRLVTSGDSNKEDMDVYGLNGHSERKGYFESHTFNKPFVATENPHTWQVRGYYRTQTWYRDGYENKIQRPFKIPDLTDEEVFRDSWTNAENFTSQKQIFNSSYDNATVRLTARKSIEQLRDIPHYAGNFRWTGHDYIGEAGYVHGGWPFRAFMGGAIDLANFEKDLYCLYQSQWTEEPMVHILPHWTHPTLKVGTKIPVWVYSNAEETELFLNGKSLGKQKPGLLEQEMMCDWLVPYEVGELKARAYNKGKVVAEKVIRTASAPSQIALSIDGEPLVQSGKDIVQVRISSLDGEGNFYPYGENRTYFHLMGNGKIKALDNGSPVDVERHWGVNSRIAFYGLTRAYIESGKNDKPLTLLAASIVGEKKLLTSSKVHIDVKTIALRRQLQQGNIEVFYTLDGSKPNKQSKKYDTAFEVTLGTTVKALVVLDGEKILYMNERFAEDEGFVFEDTTKVKPEKGEQAELATIKGGKKASKKRGYNGKGYVELSTEGSSVEWYLENDGSEANTAYGVVYHNPNKMPIKATLSINKVDYNLELRPSRGNRWDMSTLVKEKYTQGANRVTFTLNSEATVYLDYLKK